MQSLFRMHGWWLRLKATVRSHYAWWFRPGDYWYDAICESSAKLRAQLDTGDWAGARITDERAGNILGLNAKQIKYALKYGLRCRCGSFIWDQTPCQPGWAAPAKARCAWHEARR